MLDAQEYALGKHIERVVPIAHGGLGERTHGAADTRIVEHDVQSAVFVQRALQHGFDIGLAGHVRSNERSKPAIPRTVSGDECGVPGLGVVVGDHHPRAFLEKAHGGRKAHPARAAGNHCHLVLESHDSTSTLFRVKIDVRHWVSTVDHW